LVPESADAVILHFGGIVADGGVPDDSNRLAGELPRDGAFDGAGDAVAACPTPKICLLSSIATSADHLMA
jgi:hypothetical protein